MLPLLEREDFHMSNGNIWGKLFNSPQKNYEKGIQLKRDGSSDAASKYFLAAAQKGHAGAQVSYGELLEERGDREQALEWYRKAAEQGDAYALAAGGDLLLEMDEWQQALEWYRKAAEDDYQSEYQYKCCAAAVPAGRL